MKRLVIFFSLILSVLHSRAQKTLAFPFQGGREVMMTFFKDNVVIPENLKKMKATGTAVLKFTADQKGTIKKIVVYYADDYSITVPFIDALKKSDRKWVIPDEEKVHDFVISFTVNLLPQTRVSTAVEKQVYDAYQKRHPIFATNEVPLDMATLLPAIITTY